MILYYAFWVEVVLIFVGLWFYATRYLTDEQDRKIREAERRLAGRFGREGRQ
jgi:hypothetical protein